MTCARILKVTITTRVHDPNVCYYYSDRYRPFLDSTPAHPAAPYCIYFSTRKISACELLKKWASHLLKDTAFNQPQYHTASHGGWCQSAFNLEPSIATEICVPAFIILRRDHSQCQKGILGCHFWVELGEIRVMRAYGSRFAILHSLSFF